MVGLQTPNVVPYLCDVLAAFKLHIKTKFPELFEAPFLLACSGGIDSMVLTDLCTRCGLDFAMAHVNFQLRGEESDADEKWVRGVAQSLSKEYFVIHFETMDYVEEHKVSVQMAARKLRYPWFTEIMQDNDLKTLVTAHHADDNLETFLINLSRGTGVAGLTGIPERAKGLARPLLSFSREQIAAYAEKEHIEWREDRSNADTKYLRNNIRHRILPPLKDLNSDFLGNFVKTQKFLHQTAQMADNHIRQLKDSLFQEEKNHIRIPINKIAELEPLQGYLYALFNEFGFTAWNDVEHLLYAMSGKEVRSKSHRLVKNRNFLLLVPLFDGQEKIVGPNLTTKFSSESLAVVQKRTTDTYQIQETDTIIRIPVHLDIKTVDTIIETGSHILYVPKKALKYPLTLRKWRQGDYFYPFGMQGKKKLSKFFKDEKIDVIAKQNQWLLCCGKAIIWVIGRRADERFKVKNDSEEILKFELK